MTKKEMYELYEPENEKEASALDSVIENIGSWPECANCKDCVADCQLIADDYEGLLSC